MKHTTLKKGTKVKWYDTGIWRTGTVEGRSAQEALAYVMPDDPFTVNGEPVTELVRWDELRELPSQTKKS